MGFLYEHKATYLCRFDEQKFGAKIHEKFAENPPGDVITLAIYSWLNLEGKKALVGKVVSVV